MSHMSMKILKHDSETDQEQIFSDLPSEIILNILSRIPIETVITCKCVCKSWLGLLKTPDFAQSHLSKSPPRLLIHRAFVTNNTRTDTFKAFEYEDSVEIEGHTIPYKTVLELDIEKILNLSNGSGAVIEGSANGLLLLRNGDDHYVCNPITREFIRLPVPEGAHKECWEVTYGFGMSRLSNQHKIVRLFHEELDPGADPLSSIPKSVCQVYTLGTESWRSITTPCEKLRYEIECFGTFLNGNLHWLVRDSTDYWWISCLDLETEAFSEFRSPMVEPRRWYLLDLGVLRDRLCVCDDSSENETNIYLMNDYGDERKSWSKVYVISKVPDEYGYPPFYEVVCPVKAFGDGDILMVSHYPPFLGYYSNSTETFARVDVLDEGVTRFLQAMLYTPSFISLKDF